MSTDSQHFSGSCPLARHLLLIRNRTNHKQISTMLKGEKMNSESIPYRCAIVRGGTSKGVFIKENELPQEKELRDGVIRAIYGSPDIRQIDGLGGADVLTSKLAIIAPSDDPQADVDYTFAQVSFESDIIDYSGNCGNISSAVGPFAIDEGMVKAVEPITEVRIRLTNSSQILKAYVPVKNGKASVDGDCRIDGVPGTGARIDMDWSNIIGTAGKGLLPTGNAKDIVMIDATQYTVSIVDAGNPLVFIAAESLGLKGTESPEEIESDRALMELIEKIRGKAACLCGLVEKPERSAAESPYVPFFAIVSPGQDYIGLNNTVVKKEEIDIVSRLLFMLKMHKAYPITGTVCTACAARIPGTIVYDLLPPERRTEPTVRIGHPGGIIDPSVEASVTEGTVHIDSVRIYRTARRIMDGTVYVRESVLDAIKE